MAENLHSLKAIRNAFAHSTVPISFDHELIVREIESLKSFKAMRGALGGSNHKLKLDNKGWFLMLVRFLFILFDCLEKHPGTAGEAINEMLDRNETQAST